MPIRLPDCAALQDFHRAVRRHFEAQIADERRASESRKATVIPKVLEAVANTRAQGLCERAWLFGSYAWGEPGQRSDVDIFVEGRGDTIAIASIVGRACGLDVHVVDSAEAPVSLHARVMSEGYPL
jgi:predicted nucleotidyltransferase